MKIFNSKKSTEVISDFPFYMLFAIFLGVLTLILVKLGNVSVAEASKIPEDLEDQFTLASRFYNSEECFAYKDELGNVHPNVIDYSKFTKSILDAKCFPPSNINYAFQLSLEPPYVEIGPQVFPTAAIETFNWLPNKFEKTELLQDVNVVYSRGGNNFNYNGKLRIKIQNVE